ncbi:hypothetical protein [Niveispirillum sp. KHB5.9]|uniref:hypothetical protein n=1 Tax=Niveispirillum sp. KHB5.9 TaxID=3400269 RepID=UPI003A89A248
MSIHQRIHDHIQDILASDGPTEKSVEKVFDFLLHYRCLQLSNTIVHKEGTRVLGGPFAGMELVEPFNGMYAPHLLGCYEEELHDVVRGLPAAGYRHVINIGSGDGYYAVGLKRLMPEVAVWAHDIDPGLQQKCRLMAALNKVDIQVGGVFDPDGFAAHAGHRTLVWCDIEGAEATLLEPALSPALVGMDIVVELHPIEQGHTLDILPARFADSHAVEIIHPRGHMPFMPDWLRGGGQIHQLLAQFEWRGAATPWAVMRALTPAGV